MSWSGPILNQYWCIIVTRSSGNTSTKLAIDEALSEKSRITIKGVCIVLSLAFAVFILNFRVGPGIEAIKVSASLALFAVGVCIVRRTLKKTGQIDAEIRRLLYK